MKRGNAVWYNISFHCNVHSLNYISTAINMFKWNRKEAVVFDIIFHLIVNTVRKITVAEASWLTLSSTLLFAELPDFRLRELTLSSLTREVRTTEDASPKFAYLVLRNTRRPNVTRLFAYSSLYFRPRWKRRHQQVWGKKKMFLGKKSSWDKLFQVISAEKRLYMTVRVKLTRMNMNNTKHWEHLEIWFVAHIAHNVTP